jgi:hypothetical protein
MLQARFLILDFFGERRLFAELLACLQSEFARRMEKGEHDFKYERACDAMG